jgi:hypothetical protein
MEKNDVDTLTEKRRGNPAAAPAAPQHPNFANLVDRVQRESPSAHSLFSSCVVMQGPPHTPHAGSAIPFLSPAADALIPLTLSLFP